MTNMNAIKQKGAPGLLLALGQAPADLPEGFAAAVGLRWAEAARKTLRHAAYIRNRRHSSVCCGF